MCPIRYIAILSILTHPQDLTAEETRSIQRMLGWDYSGGVLLSTFPGTPLAPTHNLNAWEKAESLVKMAVGLAAAHVGNAMDDTILEVSIQASLMSLCEISYCH
jgi:hypothetical protein